MDICGTIVESWAMTFRFTATVVAPAAPVLALALLATELLGMGCAPPPPPARPSAPAEQPPRASGAEPSRASGEASSPVCAALTGPGALDTRLAELPLELGGGLYVFEGVQPDALVELFRRLDLQGTEVVGCGGNQVVVFVPGVDQEEVLRLEAIVVVETTAHTKHRAFVPPRRAGGG